MQRGVKAHSTCRSQEEQVKWEYLLLPPGSLKIKQLLIHSTENVTYKPTVPTQLLSFLPISQSLYTYILELKRNKTKHNNLLGKVSWFSAFEHPCMRKWDAKASSSAAGAPLTTSWPTLLFWATNKTGKGVYLAGRRGNLKFSWLHHFANCLLRTLQITTLLWRHFSSPVIMLTCMGTLFETPHEIEVQFSCGGKWSTPGTQPVRWTYSASLFQPPSPLSRAIPLLHFLRGAAVPPLWPPHIPTRKG